MSHVESALARTRLERAAPYARLLLALIRGLNGLTVLRVPTLLLRRMGLNLSPMARPSTSCTCSASAPR